MNYNLKIKIQNLISKLPKSESLNYFFQRRVTKSLPISFEEFKVKISVVNLHIKNFKEFGLIPISDSVYYEIGAGYDMVIPISMSLFGFKKLICVDVRKLTFISLLNDSLNKIKILNDKELQLNSLQASAKFTKKNFLTIFKDSFGIDYRAPSDARNTELKENSVDYCITNAVLEHIPFDIIHDIMKETFRIMKKGGVMSNIIDYRDHFAYFDKNITFYNYLLFSEKQWKNMNPDIMYQNRLRHKDYVKIAKDVGFEIVKEECSFPDEKLFYKLKSLKISKEISDKYTLDELKTLDSQLVLRKP